MKKILHFIFWIVFFFSVTGFSSTFNIVVNTQSEQPSFVLEKRNPITGLASSVEINSFVIVEKKNGNWDEINPLWAFELEPGKDLEVKQFKYGEAPAGFYERVKGASNRLVKNSFLQPIRPIFSTTRLIQH
ncbi:hypothetical protein [Methylomonas sp. DH-1]|uniref:hypothetical protein n=1 Tax=Methylomonas sp. (strain DH-1) TaxID=1727196 RepID=UPI000B28ED8F|nr:hypothetical protein [Methylomonas sp. DH-1]